ncbi:MAG: acyltransferase [Flammeovirgaceae bacterium]|nr:acyltransferase [Flammeovirgaceae bacterium]
MIQKIWYYVMWFYVHVGLSFYFRKLKIVGVKNIPRGQAVVFVANHQNAFLDAILLTTSQPRTVHYLVRAEIFKRPIVKKLLATLNLMPIYRIRDGWQSLSQNEEIFKACTKILTSKETLLIFPEGNHSLMRRLRPLSKGFTRIIFETLKQQPDLTLQIVPVGINYSAHQSYYGDVSIHFDIPIDSRKYFDPNDFQGSSVQIKEVVAERMKKLITHIEDLSTYENTLRYLESTQPDFTDPVEINNRIASAQVSEVVETKNGKVKSGFSIFYPIYFIAWLLNAIPLLLWKRMDKKIKDPVMVGSMKSAFAIFLFPAYYLIIAFILFQIIEPWMASVALLILIFSMPLARKFYARK